MFIEVTERYYNPGNLEDGFEGKWVDYPPQSININKIVVFGNQFISFKHNSQPMLVNETYEEIKLLIEGAKPF